MNLPTTKELDAIDHHLEAWCPPDINETFSTTTGLPHSSLSFCVTTRALASQRRRSGRARLPIRIGTRRPAIATDSFFSSLVCFEHRRLGGARAIIAYCSSWPSDLSSGATKSHRPERALRTRIAMCASLVEILWQLAHGATEADIQAAQIGSVRAMFEAAWAMKRSQGDCPWRPLGANTGFPPGSLRTRRAVILYLGKLDGHR